MQICIVSDSSNKFKTVQQMQIRKPYRILCDLFASYRYKMASIKQTKNPWRWCKRGEVTMILISTFVGFFFCVGPNLEFLKSKAAQFVAYNVIQCYTIRVPLYIALHLHSPSIYSDFIWHTTSVKIFIKYPCLHWLDFKRAPIRKFADVVSLPCTSFVLV